MAFNFTTKRMQPGDSIKAPSGETLYRMPLLYIGRNAAFMFCVNDHPVGCLVFEGGSPPMLAYTTVEGKVERETVTGDTFAGVFKLGTARMQDVVIANSQRAKSEQELFSAEPANSLPA